MKKALCIPLVVISLMLVASLSIAGYIGISSSNERIYTHEDIISLPKEKLLNLFIEAGLEINDDLKVTFTEEELQELFKSEFELLCMGISSRNDLMYFDLAEKTNAIYKTIIIEEKIRQS